MSAALALAHAMGMMRALEMKTNCLTAAVTARIETKVEDSNWGDLDHRAQFWKDSLKVIVDVLNTRMSEVADPFVSMEEGFNQFYRMRHEVATELIKTHGTILERVYKIQN